MNHNQPPSHHPSNRASRHRWWRVALCVAVILAPWPLTLPAGAAADWSAFTDPLFDRIGRDQGLPNDVVGRIVQDHTGFLWFGTGGGLVRFDGHRFRHYTSDPDDPHSLPDSYITALHVDPAGGLWVGTNAGGLARYDAASDRFDRIDAGILHNSVQSMVTDARGRLWTGTVGGLYVRDPVTGALRYFLRRGSDPDSIPIDNLRTMLVQPDGALLLGTGRGLVLFDPETGLSQPTPLAELLPDGPVHEMLRDSRGRIWVTGIFPGIALWDPATGEHRLIDLLGTGESAEQTVGKFALAEMAPDRIAVGTQGAGLLILHVDTGRIEQHRHDPTLTSSLSASDVRSLLVDRSGILWIGTWGGGISRRNPPMAALNPILASQIRPDRLSDPQVRSLMLAPDGRLWAGLQTNGIDILNPATGTRDGIRPGHGGLPEGAVLSMEMAPDGTVYVGTQRGLYRQRPGSPQLEQVPLPPPSPPSPGVWFLMRQGGTLWIAANGLVGLDLATGRMRVERTRSGDDTSLFDNRLRLLAPAADGRLWVGGHGGMHLYDPQSHVFTRIHNDPADPRSLSHDFITAILTDRRGRVWVGTLGGGINIMEPGWRPGQPAVFRRLGTAQGLPTLMVNALREDKAGRIWASTDNGLAVIDGESLSVQVLDRPDGVGVNSFWANSVTGGPDGQLMFGGRSGLVVVRPDLLDAWRVLPPTVVTDLRIGDRSVPADIYNQPSPPDIRLSPEDRSLSVEFAALDYTGPERTRFLYKLEGFESQWMTGDATRRHVSYANLAPGSYRLLVRGSNREGLFGSQALVLPVTVLPAWYQTWWFRLGLLVAGLGLVALGVQYRTHRLRRRQRELEREVHDRTLEIARQKDALSQTLADLRATQDRLVREQKLASLGRLVSGVAHELNTPLGVSITSSSFLDQEIEKLTRQVEAKNLTRTALSDFLATGRQVLDMLGTNLERAARLVQSFKQVSAEEYVGPRQNVALRPLVAETLSAFQPAFEKQGIELRLEGDDSLCVQAQPAPLAHVLTNLAQNALQHGFGSRQGGTVTISWEKGEGAQVILTFADDGAGMAADVRDKVFDPFFTTARDQGSTGLGLHIAHNLVSGPLSGSLRLDSEPGQGSRFILVLPAA